MKTFFSSLLSFTAILFLSIALLVSQPFKSAAQDSKPTQVRDGSHDFDFNFGTWRTHIKRLDNPLSNSNNWINIEGTVTVHKLWNGAGQYEDLEVNTPSGLWQGTTLFLYNPQSGQWSQTFAGRSSGVLEPAIIGEFKNGVGELYGQDTYNGRSILVRGEWSDITPDTHKFEQAFSADGGKTWEVNFSATLERIN